MSFEKISLAPADDQQKTIDPVRIIKITIEPKKTEPIQELLPVAEMRREVLCCTRVLATSL
jgi:hypothetical protein